MGEKEGCSSGTGEKGKHCAVGLWGHPTLRSLCEKAPLEPCRVRSCTPDPRSRARPQEQSPNPEKELWSCEWRGDLLPGPQMVLLTDPPSLPAQGSGRYSIYIANYAYGNVGPDALIEMDPEASDLSRGILALRDVAAEAGVSKYTGRQSGTGGPMSWRGWGLGLGFRPHKAESNSSEPTGEGASVPWGGKVKVLFYPTTHRRLPQRPPLQMMGHLVGWALAGTVGDVGHSPEGHRIFLSLEPLAPFSAVTQVIG